MDLVCVFSEATPLELIRRVRPMSWSKARIIAGNVVGGDFVESYGGRVHLARLEAGLSTTKALEKMREAA